MLQKGGPRKAHERPVQYVQTHRKGRCLATTGSCPSAAALLKPMAGCPASQAAQPSTRGKGELCALNQTQIAYDIAIQITCCGCILITRRFQCILTTANSEALASSSTRTECFRALPNLDQLLRGKVTTQAGEKRFFESGPGIQASCGSEGLRSMPAKRRTSQEATTT